MHKSAYKLRLYLMASLIVLSAVAASIGNMNLFSDAMASEKNSDKNDNYKEYEKSYYSDDENYRANYDDNYYYQQQEQSYNNNHGYEDNRKISYDNSYDNDNNKYSNYPTEDKKYVCQTGQFEGFFVESVEFCLSHNKPPAPPTPVNNNNNLSIVNTFNCINPNVININTDTNQSSSSLNGLLQPIQDSDAQSLNGDSDGLLNQIDSNKTIVNFCFINDNDDIVVNGGGGSNASELLTCEECFNETLSSEQIDDIIAFYSGEGSGVENLEDLCTLIFLNSQISGGISYSGFVDSLIQVGIPIATANKLIECLINIGIVFIP